MGKKTYDAVEGGSAFVGAVEDACHGWGEGGGSGGGGECGDEEGEGYE